jgi:hypothetical protein
MELSNYENLEVYAFGVLVIEKVKQQVYRRPSQELILPYIQMVSYLKSTLLLMTCQQQQDLEEKYLKTGILI